MEENERKLEDIAMSDTTWREATQEMLANEWELAEQTDHYALQIATSIVKGSLDLKSLRESVKLLNGLDAEAVEVSGGDIMDLDGADFMEATARRIGHHSTRTALDNVKTQTLRVGFKNRMNRVNQMMVTQMPGMGRLEVHDVSSSLVLRAGTKRVK